MRLMIRKWGNSAAVRLPASVLMELGARVGDPIEIDVSAQVATLRAGKPKYKLADLLAECNKNAPPPAEIQWD